jgi:hypothetical protein
LRFAGVAACGVAWPLIRRDASLDWLAVTTLNRATIGREEVQEGACEAPTSFLSREIVAIAFVPSMKPINPNMKPSMANESISISTLEKLLKRVV